jgi:hypothetical protein
VSDTTSLRRHEQAADRIRDELLLTLAELDRRRHAAVDLRRQVRSHRQPLLLAGGAVLGLAVLSAALKARAVRRRHRPEVVMHRRLEGLRRAWEHPERLATRAEDKPLPQELTERVLTLFVMALATRAARGFAVRLLPARPPSQQRGGA